MGKINSTKCKVGEIEFDSQLEAEYYEHLMWDDDVAEIELQPRFSFMPEFKISCGRCHGEGKKPSPKTGNLVKCRRCDGTGEINRQEWSYRADFKVKYENGKVEVVDVKGFTTPVFRYTRKMFEYQNGYELIVIKKKKGEWVKV